MPRSNNTYTLPAGYLAVNGETIQAVQHNSPLEDLAADANNARPITAGGTGATNAAGARTNLGLGTAATVNTGTGAGDVLTTAQADLRFATPADIPTVPADALARIGTGTAGSVVVFDGSGNPVELGVGSEGDALTVVGGEVAWAPLVEWSAWSAALDLSGQSTVTIPGIPANVTEVELLFDGVGASAAVYQLMRLGDAGGIEATGYVGTTTSGTTWASRNAVEIAPFGAQRHTGFVVLKRTGAAPWVVEVRTTRDGGTRVDGLGHKALSGALTQLQIFLSDTGTYTSGSTVYWRTR